MGQGPGSKEGRKYWSLSISPIRLCARSSHCTYPERVAIGLACCACIRSKVFRLAGMFVSISFSLALSHAHSLSLSISICLCVSTWRVLPQPPTDTHTHTFISHTPRKQSRSVLWHFPAKEVLPTAVVLSLSRSFSNLFVLSCFAPSLSLSPLSPSLSSAPRTCENDMRAKMFKGISSRQHVSNCQP